MSSRSPSGPITLVTSLPYDPTPPQDSMQSQPEAHCMDEDDLDDNYFASGRNIPGLDSIAESQEHDPLARRVLRTASTGMATTHSPAVVSLSNTTLASPPTSLRSANAAAEMDTDADLGTESPTRASSTGGTSNNSRASSSKNKRQDLFDIVRACTSEQAAARIRIEEERTKREEMRLQYQREESIRRENREREESERQERFNRDPSEQQERTTKMLVDVLAEHNRLMLQFMGKGGGDRQQIGITSDPAFASMPGQHTAEEGRSQPGV